MSGALIILVSLGLAILAGVGVARLRHLQLPVPAAALVAVVLLASGGLSCFGHYRVDARTQVAGIPLPAAVFQKNDHGQVEDFVGPLTGPFMLINAAIWVGVTAFLVTTIVRRYWPTAYGSAKSGAAQRPRAADRT